MDKKEKGYPNGNGGKENSKKGKPKPPKDSKKRIQK